MLINCKQALAVKQPAVGGSQAGISENIQLAKIFLLVSACEKNASAFLFCVLPGDINTGECSQYGKLPLNTVNRYDFGMAVFHTEDIRQMQVQTLAFARKEKGSHLFKQA